MIELSAIVSCIVLASLALFQLALIFGAPLGKYAWGGTHTVLPTSLRIGSAVSILLYALIAAIILSKADIVSVITADAVVNVGSWVIAAYFSIGIVLNGISRSKAERNLMTPLVTVLALMAALIALS